MRVLRVDFPGGEEPAYLSDPSRDDVRAVCSEYRRLHPSRLGRGMLFTFTELDMTPEEYAALPATNFSHRMTRGLRGDPGA